MSKETTIISNYFEKAINGLPISEQEAHQAFNVFSQMRCGPKEWMEETPDEEKDLDEMYERYKVKQG